MLVIEFKFHYRESPDFEDYITWQNLTCIDIVTFYIFRGEKQCNYLNKKFRQKICRFKSDKSYASENPICI